MSLVLSGANLTWAGQPASLDARAVLSADACDGRDAPGSRWQAARLLATPASRLPKGSCLAHASNGPRSTSARSPGRSSWIDPRVGAVSKGGLTAEWTGTDFMTGVGRLQSTLTPNAREPRSVPLGGTLVASLDRGRWQAGLRQFRIGAGLVTLEASGRLDPDDSDGHHARWPVRGGDGRSGRLARPPAAGRPPAAVGRGRDPRHARRRRCGPGRPSAARWRRRVSAAASRRPDSTSPAWDPERSTPASPPTARWSDSTRGCSQSDPTR